MYKSDRDHFSLLFKACWLDIQDLLYSLEGWQVVCFFWFQISIRMFLEIKSLRIFPSNSYWYTHTYTHKHTLSHHITSWYDKLFMVLWQVVLSVLVIDFIWLIPITQLHTCNTAFTDSPLALLAFVLLTQALIMVVATFVAIKSLKLPPSAHQEMRPFAAALMWALSALTCNYIEWINEWMNEWFTWNCWFAVLWWLRQSSSSLLVTPFKGWHVNNINNHYC